MAAAAETLAADRMKPPIVYVPAYFCNSSLGPLRATGCQLVFYPIGSDLTPLWADLNRLAAANPPDLLFLVHYFGFPGQAAEAAHWCERHGAWLVEDAAHVLYPIPGVGEAGWATLFSPHKLWPVPELGLLIVHTAPAVGESRAPARSRRRTAEWLARKAAQAALVALGVRWHQAKSRFSDDPVDPRGQSAGMLPGARRWLAAAERDLKRAVVARQRNYRRLAEATVESGTAARPLVASGAADVAPYLFVAQLPIETAESVFRRAAAAGLPVGTWPDLPPEVAAGPPSEATRLRASVITLPVHQGIGDAQAAWMADRWCQVLRSA